MSTSTRGRGGQRRRRRWPLVLLVTILVGVLGAVTTLLRAQWEVANTTLVETTHQTAELSGEFRLLQITDFHNLPDPAQVDSVVALAGQARPDAVALTGDLINTHNSDLAPVERLLDGLSGLGVPMFYVDGNHDHWSRDQAQLHSLLRAAGVTVLDDEHTTLRGPWGSVDLVGVDDYFTGNGDLPAAVEGLSADGFRLVITHSPQIFDVLDANDVDYAICGHTHGGQIRLPFDIALYTPGGGWFPKLSKGHYTDGDATLFIDSGVGVTGPKYRLFNQSQIVLHRLSP